jgi:hypothetical protein
MPAVVETTASAEELPADFITPNNEDMPPDDTDRVNTYGDKAIPKPAPVTPPQVDMNATGRGIPKSSGATGGIPTDLAQELDRVVAKFEEEMNKAEKN